MLHGRTAADPAVDWPGEDDSREHRVGTLGSPLVARPAAQLRALDAQGTGTAHAMAGRANPIEGAEGGVSMTSSAMAQRGERPEQPASSDVSIARSLVDREDLLQLLDRACWIAP
jgi:hypothetical protein